MLEVQFFVETCYFECQYLAVDHVGSFFLATYDLGEQYMVSKT